MVSGPSARPGEEDKLRYGRVAHLPSSNLILELPFRLAHPLRSSAKGGMRRLVGSYDEKLKVISTRKSIGVGSPSRTVGSYFRLETAFKAD